LLTWSGFLCSRFFICYEQSPDVTQDAHEQEHYAHEVAHHVKKIYDGRATLLVFTGITVALSYFDFGTRKMNIAVAMLVA